MASIKLFGLYALLWIIISEGVIELYPTIFILFLSLITPHLFTLHYKKISFVAAFKLIFWFFLYSLKGGLQVALMALRPKCNPKPFIYSYQLRPHTPLSITLLANIYSLMPGTLSIDKKEEILLLHILDSSLFEVALLERFENYVFDLFTEEYGV